MDTRYSRQLALPGFGADAQQKLGNARVLVIGAGGLGSATLPALAAVGVGAGEAGMITIVDDDRVELSNLHRQHVHSTDDLGRPKAESAAESMRAINPHVTVHVVEQRLASDNARQLVRDHDLVLDGSDNFATRYLVADAVTLEARTLVWGAVNQYGGQAGAVAPGTPGYRDLFPTPPPPGSVPSCEVGGVLPTTVGVIGAIMATEAIKLLTGVGRPLLGRVTTFDALSGTFRELSFDHDPTAEPVTGLIDYEAFCGEPSAAAESAESRAMTASGEPGAETDPRTVSAAELAAELDRNQPLVLIDVRETWEAEIASLPGALVIPLGTVPAVVGDLDPGAQYVVYCHHGIRSLSGLRILEDAGLTARHLEGGIDAWALAVDPTMARY
jgi:sulfur-carrier protein adenylyltransferase/sulfurtransferase